MKKLSIIAFAIVVAAGCGKKDDNKSVSEKTTEMGKDNPKAATPETATDPGNDKKTETPAAPPVGQIEGVADVPAGLPQDCIDAHAVMKKMAGCDKISPDIKAPMIKAWNLAVTNSFDAYARASDRNKETIKGSCASMVKNSTELTKDCP